MDLTAEIVLTSLLTAIHSFLWSFRSHFFPPLTFHFNDVSADSAGSNNFRKSVAPATPFQQSASSDSSRSRKFSNRWRRASVEKETDADESALVSAVVVVDNDFRDLLGGQGRTASSASQRSLTAILSRQLSEREIVDGQPSTTPPGPSHSFPVHIAYQAKRLCSTSAPAAICHFFESRFQGARKEQAYRSESWLFGKPQAITSAVFLTVAWIVTVATQVKPFSTLFKVAYAGVGAASVAPVIPLVAFDLPRRRPIIWQLVLFVATWTLPYVIIFDMWDCNYYVPNSARCPQKDFGVLFLVPAST